MAPSARTDGAITIHYVLEGSGTLRLEEGGGRRVRAAQHHLVPPGQAQSLAALARSCGKRATRTTACFLADGLIAFSAGRR
jgi:hypothetical protein